MASLRILKRDIDYLIEAVVSDCYLSIYFNSNKKEEISALISEAIATRNDLFERVNNPAEKHNKKLVKKHYAQINREVFVKVDELLAKLSTLAE